MPGILKDSGQGPEGIGETPREDRKGSRSRLAAGRDRAGRPGDDRDAARGGPAGRRPAVPVASAGAPRRGPEAPAAEQAGGPPHDPGAGRPDEGDPGESLGPDLPWSTARRSRASSSPTSAWPRRARRSWTSMINRVLIEQALARQKMAVTAAEIDEEIDGDRPAVRHRPRGLAPHPGQGARASARRSTPARSSTRPSPCGSSAPTGSQVTPKDLQEALRVAVRREAAGPDDPGEQVSYKAMQIWEELHKNTGGVRERRQGEVDGSGAASRWAACWPSRSPGTPTRGT